MENRYYDDLALVEGLKRGKRDAVNQLCIRLFNKLAFAAFQKTGDQQASQDIATDTFITCCPHFRKLQNMQEVENYLFKSVHYACIDFLSKRYGKSEPHIVFGENADEPEEVIMQNILRSEKMKTIYEKVGMLPDKQKKVILMHYWDDMTHEEIAAIMGIGQNQVRNLKHRGQQFLKKLFLEDNDLIMLLIFWIMAGFRQSFIMQGIAC